jgi:hypothetical protein
MFLALGREYYCRDIGFYVSTTKVCSYTILTHCILLLLFYTQQILYNPALYKQAYQDTGIVIIR